jgi:GDPmannose 4,6-dehydratase
MKKRAFITGVTGQDGSYLSEFLLEKGYEVHGMIRRASYFNRKRVDHLFKDTQGKNVRFFLHYGDMSDSSNMNRLLEKINPHEIYNLAAQSHVGVSFEVPEYTVDVNAIGTLRILDGIKDTGIKSRFYQASTSELFGKAREFPQDEKTPFYPRSPYAIAKLYAHWIVVNYREAYSLHASNGICFNHESPRRGENFITRKITMAAAAIKANKKDCLYLGNLNVKRDWGYAPDYVRAMWLMLQKEKPDDYVIATGETHSVREFVEKTFSFLDIKIRWLGKNEKETGVDKKTGKTIVRIDPKYYRPTEVDVLIGNPAKAKKFLGWKSSISFEQLVETMIKADWDEVKNGER